MKKNHTLISLFLFGILILGIATIVPQRSAYAACYDIKTKTQIPCPPSGKSDYSKKNQATNVPTKTPAPTPTNMPKPTEAAKVIPQAACQSLNPDLANGSAPTQPSSDSPSFPWLLGGGGLVLGLVVGFFTGGVRGNRNFSGNGLGGGSFEKSKAINDLEGNPVFANAIKDINQDIKKQKESENALRTAVKADINQAYTLLVASGKLEKDANGLEQPVGNDNNKNGNGKDPT